MAQTNKSTFPSEQRTSLVDTTSIKVVTSEVNNTIEAKPVANSGFPYPPLFYTAGLTLMVTVSLFSLTRYLSGKDRLRERKYNSELFIYQKTVFPLSESAMEYIVNVFSCTQEALENAKKHTVSSSERTSAIQSAITQIEILQKEFLDVSLSKSFIYKDSVAKDITKQEETLNDTVTLLISNLNSSTLAIDYTTTYMNKLYASRDLFVSGVNSTIRVYHPQLII